LDPIWKETKLLHFKKKMGLNWTKTNNYGSNWI